jgi:hypothetical protein
MCPFSAPLVAEDFACRQAEPVIRRGGTEIACRSETSCTRCSDLHRVIKAAALADQDYTDDLTLVPHSLLVRIQYGGLLGLQRLIDGSSDSATRIDDIDSLVETALARFGGPPGIPAAELSLDIAACKLPGRRSRKQRRRNDA